MSEPPSCQGPSPSQSPPSYASTTAVILLPPTTMEGFTPSLGFFALGVRQEARHHNLLTTTQHRRSLDRLYSPLSHQQHFHAARAPSLLTVNLSGARPSRCCHCGRGPSDHFHQGPSPLHLPSPPSPPLPSPTTLDQTPPPPLNGVGGWTSLWCGVNCLVALRGVAGRIDDVRTSNWKLA